MLSKTVSVQTEDGSYTLFDPTRQIHYRSMHGASSESMYVFFQGTRIEDRPTPWNILELGFGTGMNFLSTAQAFRQKGIKGKLRYHGVDWKPVTPELLNSLHFTEWLEDKTLLELVKDVLAQGQRDSPRIHQVQSPEGDIELNLYAQAWEDCHIPDLQADAIYFDPFGPRDNPESWTREAFFWVARHTAADGILATYSAASKVRQALAEAGFFVAKAPGAGRKREMTVASPNADSLSTFKILQQERFQPSKSKQSKQNDLD